MAFGAAVYQTADPSPIPGSIDQASRLRSGAIACRTGQRQENGLARAVRTTRGSMATIQDHAAVAVRGARTKNIRHLGGVLGALLAAGCSGSPAPTESAELDLTSRSSMLAVSGPRGGPFSGGASGYELVNRSSKRTIAWTVETEQAWLILSPDSGVLDPGHVTTIAAAVDPAWASGAAPGSHSASIVVSDEGRGTHTSMQFVVNVLSPGGGGSLIVSPEVDVEIDGDVGSPLDTSQATFTLSNGGGGPVGWSASIDQNWVQLPGETAGTLDAGQAMDLSLEIDQEAVTSLTPGIHRARLMVDEIVNGASRTVIERTLRLRRRLVGLGRHQRRAPLRPGNDGDGRVADDGLAPRRGPAGLAGCDADHDVRRCAKGRLCLLGEWRAHS